MSTVTFDQHRAMQSRTRDSLGRGQDSTAAITWEIAVEEENGGGGGVEGEWGPSLSRHRSCVVLTHAFLFLRNSRSSAQLDWLVPPDADFHAVINAFHRRNEMVDAIDSLAENSPNSGRLCSSYFRGVRSLTANTAAVDDPGALVPALDCARA